MYNATNKYRGPVVSHFFNIRSYVFSYFSHSDWCRLESYYDFKQQFPDCRLNPLVYIYYLFALHKVSFKSLDLFAFGLSVIFVLLYYQFYVMNILSLSVAYL